MKSPSFRFQIWGMPLIQCIHLLRFGFQLLSWENGGEIAYRTT